MSPSAGLILWWWKGVSRVSDFSVTVTRHIPTVELPGLGDVNGDGTVDVTDLALVGKTLGTQYDPGP